MSSGFVQAAVILLREGLEAILVIAALAGYLNKAGSGHRINALYVGGIVALVASLITAWAFATFNNGDHSDLLEGFVILAASAIMLYVSGWLMLKQEPQAWNDYLASKADSALAQDTAWAVGALAFFAVFREGAETVLFISALVSAEGGFNAGIVSGLAAATVGLVVLFFIINRAAKKIPLRPLFIITSAFLFIMGVRFIGDALQEFQEQTWISFTQVSNSGWLEALGLNPTVEALSIQLLVILFAVASYSLFRRNSRMLRDIRTGKPGV